MLDLLREEVKRVRDANKRCLKHEMNKHIYPGIFNTNSGINPSSIKIEKYNF